MTSQDISHQLKKVFMEIIKDYRDTYRGSLLAELEVPEMTFKQFVYLDTIIRMQSPTYGDLAKKFKVSKPAVTAIISKLIGLGYLERVQSAEDHRVFHLLITDKGKRLLAIDEKAAAVFLGCMETCLTKEELNQYICTMEKVIACRASEMR